MKVVEKKKDRLYVLGIPLIGEKVRNGCLVRSVLGIPVLRRRTPLSELLSKVEGLRDFDSTALDHEIAERFSGLSVLPSSLSVTRPRVAILTTKLRDRGGGDMRWMEDVARLLKGKFDIGLFVSDFPRSRKAGGQVLRRFSEFCTVGGIPTFPSDVENEVRDLARQISDFAPRVVFCFIRPTDLRAAAALSVLKRCTGIKVVYYLHASERPCVGVSFGDLLPQPSPFLTRMCVERRHVNRCLTSPSVLTCGSKDHETRDLTPAERQSVRRELGVAEENLMTLSGGEASKFFDSPSESEYFVTIRQLLERNAEVTHVILADFSTRQKEVIDGLFAGCTARARLVLHGRTSQYERIFQSADVFLDSFPMGGAYTMLDLMRLGVPYVVKINAADPSRSFHEYQDPNYPYMFARVEDFLSGAERLLRDASARRDAVALNRRHYAACFSAAPCRALLEKIVAHAEGLSDLFESKEEGRHV